MNLRIFTQEAYMSKSIITPIQAWLLSQGKCFSCGMSLRKAKVEAGDNGVKKLLCQCGRIFFFDQKNQRYYRKNSQVVLK
jgi:hypothetical protein